MNTYPAIVRVSCLIILTVVMLAAPAAAGCKDDCTGPTKLSCKNTPAKYTGTKGFKASQFEYSCLGDAGQDCTDKSNTLDPTNSTLSCCSCYLYAAASKQPKGTIFVNKPLSATNTHVLVIPANPCTGVENWDNGVANGCPGEAIWNTGAEEIDKNKLTGIFGMAINPIGRRGHHQMHVHLAKVQHTLLKAIKDVYKSGNTTWHVDCGGRATLQNCHPLGPKEQVTDKHLKVQLFLDTANPANARPFYRVYGNNPSASSSTSVVSSSALVVALPKQTWAVVTNPTGAAEDMLEV